MHNGDMQGAAHLNLILGWVWITAGFVAGFVMGLFFHKEDWLGGYGSYRRRLYRLGHVAFFGLAIINLLFYFTVRSLELDGPWIELASKSFAVGAVAMPVCCAIMANAPKQRALFLIPVLSLVSGAVLLLAEIL